MNAKVRGREGIGLAVAIVAVGAVLAGCGSGKSSSSTSSSSSAQTLRQWELRVTNSGSARAPAPSFMERLAGYLGWPQVAEASTGVPGCTVSAPGPGGTVTGVTDGSGKVVLPNVNTPGTATVNCPGLATVNLPINGPPGSIIEVKVTVGNGRFRVTAEAEDASPSEPSISEPSPSVSEEDLSLRRKG